MLLTLLFSFNSASAGDCCSSKARKCSTKKYECAHRDHHRGEGIDGSDFYDDWEMDKDHSNCCTTWYDNCSHHCNYCPPAKTGDCGNNKATCCEKKAVKKCSRAKKCC